MNDLNPALQVFTCELILEKIFSFLPMEDLKTLTIVTSGIKQAARRTKQFSNRIRLHVTKDTIQSRVIAEGIFFPKHVFLELFNYLTLERGLIRKIVEGAESLQLGSQQHPPLAFDEVFFNHYMNQVLTLAKKLRSLELSSSILYRVSPYLFYLPEIQETFTRLHSLKITVDQAQVFPERLHEVFRQSFAKISTLPLNLKSFHFGKLNFNCDGGLKKKYVSFIPLLIEKTKGTLEELELLDARIWMLDEMAGVTCPNLKRLSISALGIDRSFLTVETFLQKQLPLEEVDIYLSVFPRQIVEMIIESSSKLKRLGLKAKEFVGEAPTIDWTKLEGMAELKEFSLVMTYEAFQTLNSPSWKERAENILRSLPPTVEKITLEGFRYFWRRGQNLQRKNVGQLLSRFGNLTELSLNRCYWAMTDVGLQSVISLCPKLSRLSFSHSNHVTKYGVTGVQDGDVVKTGVSLDELKGLTHLAIRNCPNISPEVLVDVLRFNCLRSLDYFRTNPVPKEVLVRAARNNPSLERLRMNVKGGHTAPRDLTALKKEVMKANPRIRYLRVEEHRWSYDTSG